MTNINIINEILQKISLDNSDINLSYSPTDSAVSADINNPNDVLKECASILIDNFFTQYIEKQADKICANAGISTDNLIYASDALKWQVTHAVENINQTFANKTDAVSELNSAVYGKLLRLYNIQLAILDYRIENFVDYNSAPLKPLKAVQQKSSAANLSDADRLSIAKKLSDAFLTGNAYTANFLNRTIGIDKSTLTDELNDISKIVCDKIFSIMNGDDAVAAEISSTLDELQQNIADYDDKVNRLLNQWHDIETAGGDDSRLI